MNKFRMHIKCEYYHSSSNDNRIGYIIEFLNVSSKTIAVIMDSETSVLYELIMGAELIKVIDDKETPMEAIVEE